MATLVKAGMPIHRALDLLARAEPRRVFKDVLAGMAETIRAGGNLSDGLAKHEAVFDRLYLGMVRAGEAGGVLGEVLDRLAHYLERSERIKGRVRASLAYPVILMSLAGAILAGLLIFVIPKFEQIFQGLLKGQPLPPLTRLLLMISRSAGHDFLLESGLLVVAWLALRAWRRTHQGARAMDVMMIRIPLVGGLLLKAGIARFARIFGSMLASGVPILDALTITRETSGNLRITEALNRVHAQIKSGATLARSLEKTAIFPHLVTSLIEVGEETGALPDMLGRIADAYDEEVDNAVAALTSIIEPLMIVLMAVLVAFIVVALFLPLVGVIQHLQ